MKVGVGSRNPAKIDAARNVLQAALGSVDVRAHDVETGVPDQPVTAAEILDGARNRATGSLTSEEELGVGIEAGLVDQPDGSRFDVQYCAIADPDGVVTVGHGPGFKYPSEVEDAVDRGEEVGDVMSRLSGIDGIGRTVGAIGYLTRGHVDRTRLTESAVWMALVPRLREDLYRPHG